MKRTFTLTLLAILFCTILSGQTKDDYLVAFCDSTKGANGLYGYQTPDGEVAIHACYLFVYTDTLYKAGFVVSQDNGMIAIDRKGNFLLTPFIFDNGPDYLHEGLFRYEENGKMGFADADCNIVIPAQFDFAEPFGKLHDFGQFIDYDDWEDSDIEHYEQGLAIYYIGGEKHKMGEYWYWDKWDEMGYVNKKGQRFARISPWKGDGWEAWTTDGKHVELNNGGEIIKTF
ncbi:WG repeat-containing protein [Dysgonomonas sp. 25]|uniref:WG repeat-containing protein n=1 Tax=Dysgonomonas sp. 25 TaxID=2302933 RepID=UPI0013D21002|nr:WG repeat-containing protein [Dysgonomonas sp. 25]NDV68420.1 hypothetical protein [Dysgonomonas sp. 25]